MLENGVVLPLTSLDTKGGSTSERMRNVPMPIALYLGRTKCKDLALCVQNDDLSASVL